MALQLGLAPVLAQNSPGTIADALPLFTSNHCEQHREAANQLFCGDPDLSEAAAKLTEAVDARLNRLPDRLMAIEENAEWIRNRNTSCGLFPHAPIRLDSLDTVTTCLLKETEERIAILRDPNFDCLATDTAAGAMICSDPSLAIADGELDAQVLTLIAKLNDSDAKNAFVEYARWIRERDRKCDLAGRENVPLSELASNQDCLAKALADMTTEVVAAKGDPRKLFGHRPVVRQPDADAVDVCVAQIHLANACNGFLRVRQVREIGSDITNTDAKVTAEVEMVVLAPFTVCSPVAASCTGACWDARSGRPMTPPGTRESFAVARRIKIKKAFAFQKGNDGNWQCSANALAPIDAGVSSP